MLRPSTNKALRPEASNPKIGDSPNKAPPDAKAFSSIVCRVVPGIADSTGRRRDCALAVGWKHLLLPLLISLHATCVLRHESYSRYVKIARATNVKLVVADSTLLDLWQDYVLGAG